nr:transposase [Catellatospora tritici]
MRAGVDEAVARRSMLSGLKVDALEGFSTPSVRIFGRELYRFYRRCAESGLPELERLATTVQTWWPEILAFIRTGITKAGSPDRGVDANDRPELVPRRVIFVIQVT